MITTVQYNICSQLNNKHRVVVTDFRLHHTCSIIILWLHSLSGVIRSLLCNPLVSSPAIINISISCRSRLLVFARVQVYIVASCLCVRKARFIGFLHSISINIKNCKEA